MPIVEEPAIVSPASVCAASLPVGADSPSYQPSPVVPDLQSPLPLNPVEPGSDMQQRQPALTSPSLQAQASPSSGETVSVTRIELTGSTVFGPSDINPIVQPLEGKPATLDQLRGVADAITQLYLDKGYITSRAVLVEQTVNGGVVQIQAIEGTLEDIVIEGTQRLNPNYVRSRIQLAGSPLNREKLEDQLRLLRADPLFDNVEASLRSGTQPGQSILTVRVVEANPLAVSLSADNFSPPAVGSERFGVGVSYRNLTGFGDQLAASYTRTTTGGANLYDFSYRLPINAMDGTIVLRAAPSDYRITDPSVSFFDIRGNTELYEGTFRQPLIRTPREELAVSLGFTYQSGQTFLFNNIPFGFGIGPDANGVSRTSVFKFGQDYVSRDLQGAWSARSQFSFGTGLFNATSNPNPIPDGNFFSWLGQVQRVQVLSNDSILIAGADLQLTPDTLLPSQQFVIGGGQSVRGFRQNARAGDNGFRFSLENRIVVLRDDAGVTLVQLAPFVDAGAIWNVGGNPNTVSNQQTFLAGGGLGVIWQAAPRFGVRLDYAIPFINLNDRGSNAQESAFYFSINYQP